MYSEVKNLYRAPEMYNFMEFYMRCARTTVEGEITQYTNEAREYITDTVLKDPEAKKFYNEPLLKAIVSKIAAAVLNNIIAAMEKTINLPFLLYNEESQAVLEAAIEREDCEDGSEKNNELEVKRKKNAATRIDAIRTNLEIAKMAGVLSEYNYAYGTPKNPKDWDDYEESLKKKKPQASQAPQATAAPQTPGVTPINEAKYKKWLDTKQAKRVIEICKRNMAKNVPDEDLNRVLSSSMDREFKNFRLKPQEIFMLAACIKAAANAELNKEKQQQTEATGN